MWSRIIVCSTVLTVAVFSVVFMWKRRNRVKNIGKVKKLIFYPIKSLPGFEVQSLNVTKSGVRYGQWIDRGFMLLDMKTNFMVTLRQKASLTLLKLSLKNSDDGGDELWIESPQQQPVLKIKCDYDLKADDENEVKILENSVWGGPAVKCVDCGDDAASWFQEYLQNENIRLVRHCFRFPLRPSYEVKGAVEDRNDDERIVFHDANAVHIVNDASVNDFKAKVSDEYSVSYRNFRPNIVVDTEPYSEDNWNEVKINSVLLRKQKRTGRCTVPGVNPYTANRMTEVLDTLRKHRSVKSKDDVAVYGKDPILGINCCVRETGTITTNDDVIVSV